MSADQRPRTPPWVAGLAWLLCGASLTLGILGLVLESLNGHRITDTLVVGRIAGDHTFDGRRVVATRAGRAAAQPQGMSGRPRMA